MKKTLAIALALMLSLLCFAACAEEAAAKLNENNDVLDFFLVVPNGMSMEQSAFDPGVVGSIEVGGLPDILIMFSLMPDDSYTNMEMSELTTADVENLSGLVMEDLGESTSELYDMPCGLKAMVIRDKGNTEYIAMTLKDGYFFYMTGFHADFSPLTDEEMQAVKGAFDSLSYTEKK